VDDEDAPQAASMTPVHEIPHSFFGFLFGEAVEIKMILHRHLTPFEPFHELSAESLDGSLGVFIAERDVQLHGAFHQAVEVSHNRLLVIRRGVGGLDAACTRPRGLLLFVRERGNAVHGFEKGLQLLISLLLNDRFRGQFFRLWF